jgi:hypothetical protein
MGMVALDLRAAGQEQKLVQHEMRSLLVSYQAEEAQLQQAIAAAAARISIIMLEQDALSEQLQAASGPGQQWHELQCRYHKLLQEQRELLGKQVLLRARCVRVQQLLHGAQRLLGRYISSDGQEQQLTAEQLAEVADDEVRQQEADGPVGDGEEGDDAEAALWDEEVAASPAAGPGSDDATGTDAAAAAGPAGPAGAGRAAGVPAAGAGAATEVWHFWWSEQVRALLAVVRLVSCIVCVCAVTAWCSC